MQNSKPHFTALWLLLLGLILAGAPAAANAGADAGETPAKFYADGNALFDQGRFAEAAAAYDRALGADPKYVEAAYNRALANEMVDRSRAIVNWQRFLEAAGDRSEFKWDAARARARMQILKDKPPLPDAMQ